MLPKSIARRSSRIYRDVLAILDAEGEIPLHDLAARVGTAASTLNERMPDYNVILIQSGVPHRIRRRVRDGRPTWRLQLTNS